MKFKKIISIALSAAMLGSTATILASAEETVDEQKTYNYVCIGDSIASGYGLEKAEAQYDRALILSEELIANPIQDAYAQVFGNYLAELGAENGYTTTATNIAATAYRAEDIERLIYTPGYKGEVATHILESFVAPGTSEALVPYYDIYQKYLTQADLVSIQLGGNDIIMAIVYPMVESENPILHAMGTSVALVLFGYDVKTALGAGLMLIEKAKDDITVEHVTEAAKYFSDTARTADTLPGKAADNVQKVVDAVQSVNSDTDIAIVGMFNPYGTSLEYDGQVRDLCNVMTNIFTRAVNEVVEVKVETGEVEVLPAEEAEEKAEELSDDVQHLNQYVKISAEYTSKTIKERLESLLKIVTEEISYPMQYLFAGKTSDRQIKSLNENLVAVAEAEGIDYVNVYDISNENNLDPHPTKEGHKEIADRMIAALTDNVTNKMQGIEETETYLVGDVDLDGKITVADVTLMQKANAELIVLTDLQMQLAKINDKLGFNISDATDLQRYVAQMPTNNRIGTRIAKCFLHK